MVTCKFSSAASFRPRNRETGAAADTVPTLTAQRPTGEKDDDFESIRRASTEPLRMRRRQVGVSGEPWAPAG